MAKLIESCLGRDNWPKPACSLVLSEAISNQAVWPVISAITGPICALAPKVRNSNELSTRGHHDWPVMAIKHALRTHGGSGTEPPLLRTNPTSPWIATTTEERLPSAKQREAAEQLQIKLISAHSGLTASRRQQSQSASTPPSAQASARSRPFCRPSAKEDARSSRPL